jgi:polyhydroxybutyrate depolymerase
MKFEMKPAVFVFLAALCFAARTVLGANENAQPADTRSPQGFSRIEMQVDGVDRSALVYAPKSATSTNTPLVFVFHGHGGSSLQMARRVPMDRDWPEAISVYMQGLATPGPLTDPEGKKTGWQHGLGDQNDRDLKFFDAILTKLKHDYKVDERRIYATGHSNGGGFTYLLWQTRSDFFAAFAPASTALKKVAELKPKPVLHIAGKNDPLVKIEWQQLTMDALKKNNGCDDKGEPWGANCTIYPSLSGTPLVEFVHPGGHELPSGASVAIAKFFKENPPADK